jgi:hypothetical protein
MTRKKIVWITGILDAALIFSFPFFFVLLVLLADPSELNHAMDLLQTKALHWIAVCIPMSALALWRGTAHTARMLDGRSDVPRPLIEGFAAGFVPTFLWFLVLAVREATAAGNAWDGARSWGLFGWGLYVAFSFQMSLLVGLFGAALAGVMSLLNRLVIRLTAPANPSLHRSRKSAAR